MSDAAPAPASPVPTSPEIAAVAPEPTRRRWLRPLLLGVVPLLVLAGIGLFWLQGGRVVETEDAYVKADKLSVSTQVAGTVREVAVQDNQLVKAGQPLFRLDDASARVAVARAQARLAQVRADLAALRAGYHEKQAEIALARTRQGYALKDQQRQADLVAQNFISAARFSDAEQASDVARQQVGALQQDLSRIAEQLGGSVDLPVERHPSWLAARAELEQAQLDLARTEVRAPLAGVVSKPPRVGQYLATGSTAMALVVSGTLWVEANFTETDLTHVRVGNPVTLHVDTYPDQVWHGEVESLSPATGAEFSLIPAQNATGNWVKIAQRVPVRIHIEASPGQPELRAGLSTLAEIDTGHRRRLFGHVL